MKEIKVETKQELEKAYKLKPDRIIVTGELVEKLIKSKKITKISRAVVIGLATLVVGGTIIVPPIGMGALAVSGSGVAAIIIASGIGIALVYAIYKDYDVIVTMEKDGRPKLILTKKGFKMREKKENEQ
ncbi:MAG: hypothetical protein FWG77_03915 [Treponema sp.]|nr:hypothetical protein [Treponema sp.]